MRLLLVGGRFAYRRHRIRRNWYVTRLGFEPLLNSNQPLLSPAFALAHSRIIDHTFMINSTKCPLNLVAMRFAVIGYLTYFYCKKLYDKLDECFDC